MFHFKSMFVCAFRHNTETLQHIELEIKLKSHFTIVTFGLSLYYLVHLYNFLYKFKII